MVLDCETGPIRLRLAAQLAAAMGFLVVAPEHLTLTEQIALAARATVLCGPSGSALHLSVFAGPGARVE